MVQDQGIDVYLAPYGDISKRYPEHAVPTTSRAFSGNPNEVYIEAVDGERFVIVVDLLKDYDAKGSERLKIEYRIDGGGFLHQPSYSELAKSTRKQAGLQGRTIADSEVKKVDGRWMDCGYTFAQLKMDEEMDMDADQVASRVNMHGKIDVVITRGTRLQMKSKHSQPRLWNGCEPPDTHVSYKAVVKDNHISHAIRHVVLGDAHQPSLSTTSTREWKSLPGQGGEKISFTIRYRSHDVLQKLKIIPKDQVHVDLTGSPPPSPKLKREKMPGFIKRETGGTGPVERSIKQEPFVQPPTANAHVLPEASITTETTNDTPRERRDNKRKAVQDELVEIELEQRKVELEQQEVRLKQKRLRLKKALEDMEGSGD